MPQLLREYYELCPGGICEDLLTESEKSFVREGGLILSGKLQEAECENGHGRVYPLPILSREVGKYSKIVADNRALGELDHPDSSIVNLANVSHMVTKIWMEGPAVMGKIKVLTTPSGQILRSLIEAQVKIGISSRGLGSVRDEHGKTYVEDDFQLICFDFVSEPSTPNAFMMREAKDLQSINILTKADKINRLLNEVLDND